MITMSAAADTECVPKHIGRLIRALVTINVGKELHLLQSLQPTIIVVIDTSGSMVKSLPIIKHAMSRLLDSADSSWYLSLVCFNKNVYGMPAPVQCTPDNVALLRAEIAALSAFGGTAITPAIRAALVQVRSWPRECVMMLFTDGMNTSGGWAEALADLRETILRTPFPLHVFAVGDDPDPTQLIYLANSSAGGHYAYIPTIYDVNQVFGDALAAIKAQIYARCIVTFIAPTGSRIISINGVESSEKRCEYWIGAMAAGSQRVFICELSLRGVDVPVHHVLTAELTSANIRLASARVYVNRNNKHTNITCALKAQFRAAALDAYMRFVVGQALIYADNGDYESAIDLIDTTIQRFAAETPATVLRVLKNNLARRDAQDSPPQYTIPSYSLFSFNV